MGEEEREKEECVEHGELLTYSKNMQRRRFGVAEMEVVPFPPLQPISSSDDDPGISSSLTPASGDDLDILMVEEMKALSKNDT